MSTCENCKYIEKYPDLKPCINCKRRDILRPDLFEPEEQKVITADEWFDNQKGIRYLPDEETKHLIFCWTCAAFNDGHKEGRLEMFQEFDPLVKTLKEYFSDCTKGSDDLLLSIKNLPKP